MSKPENLNKLAVIWEPVPDVESDALLKAVAILFHQRVPLSTAADLTERDKTLSYGRQAKKP